MNSIHIFSLVNVIVYLANDEKFRGFVTCKSKTAKKVSFGANSVQSFETETTQVVDDDVIKEKTKTVTKVKKLKVKESKIKVVEEQVKQESEGDAKKESVEVEPSKETVGEENIQKEETSSMGESGQVEGKDNLAFEEEQK